MKLYDADNFSKNIIELVNKNNALAWNGEHKKANKIAQKLQQFYQYIDDNQEILSTVISSLFDSKNILAQHTGIVLALSFGKYTDKAIEKLKYELIEFSSAKGLTMESKIFFYANFLKEEIDRNGCIIVVKEQKNLVHYASDWFNG